MSPEAYQKFVDGGGPGEFLPGEKVHVPGVGRMSADEADAYVERQRYRPKTQEEKQAARHRDLITNAISGPPEQVAGSLMALVQAGVEVPKNAIPDAIAKIPDPAMRRNVTIGVMNALSGAKTEKTKAATDDLKLQSYQNDITRKSQEQEVMQVAHAALAGYLNGYDENAGPMSLAAVIGQTKGFDMTNPVHRAALPLIAETVVKMEKNRNAPPDPTKQEKARVDLENAKMQNAKMRQEAAMFAPVGASTPKSGGGRTLPGQYANLDEVIRAGGRPGDRFKSSVTGTWGYIQ
ncbi:MAG: hypothetical protein HQM00_02340 [Magnetococcales bacterium]|nr:hypothetical protein [Magnetococcales bacterium]